MFTFPPTVVSKEKLVQPAPTHRSMSKFVSLFELSCHLRSTKEWLGCLLGAVAVRLLGAEGGVSGGVVASAGLEKAEFPPALNALTRYVQVIVAGTGVSAYVVTPA